jgi:hypothetical protein
MAQSMKLADFFRTAAKACTIQEVGSRLRRPLVFGQWGEHFKKSGILWIQRIRIRTHGAVIYTFCCSAV